MSSSSDAPVLAVVGLAAAWDGVPVLRDVGFELAAGEFLTLLGPNGSGKTTLLRCLAGLERPVGGDVRLDGRSVVDVPTHRRGIGFMSQEPALFPNRTVLENVAYAPLLARRPEADVRLEVGRLLDLLHLRGFEARRPEQLSGGERQRVALARTLAARPKVVLLDEPFASIDPELRGELRTEFRRALAEVGTGAVHVTHDRDEGLFLGDRVGLLVDGRLESIGRPADVFAHPPSERSARLLGYNVLAGPTGLVGILPTDVVIGPPEPGRTRATVLVVGTTGSETMVALALDDGQRLDARGPAMSPGCSPGAPVSITWNREVPLPVAMGREVPDHSRLSTPRVRKNREAGRAQDPDPPWIRPK